MEGRLHEEQAESTEASVVRPAGEISTAHAGTESAVTSQSDSAEFATLLERLRRQARNHAWFGGVAALLIVLFAFSTITGIAIYSVMSGLDGHPARLIFDWGLTSFGFNGHGGRGQSEMTVSGVMPLLVLAGSAVFGGLAKRERVKLTSGIAGYEDVRAVGPLIEALYLRDRQVRRQAASTLARLLPMMRPEDAAQITDHQRTLLNLYLGRSRWSLLQDDDELSLAILRAYPHIGDGTEVPYVKRLEAGKGSAGRNAAAREAARAYLDELKRRADLEKSRQTLLRPTAAVTADVLLRPAQDAGSDSGTLLRAHDANDKVAPDTHES